MAQGPATPAYVLRGHVAPIHSLLFFDCNAYLASGDSDGWLVIWSLASKRPVAVWKAHDGGTSGIKTWGRERLITHGRDHKLRVWQLNLDGGSSLSIKLPVDGAQADKALRPWQLHSLDISALNFCTFATCEKPVKENQTTRSLLLATPNGLDSGGVDIFQLPSERRISQIESNKSINTGMVMAVSLFYGNESHQLWLVSGYEDGQVMVHIHNGRVNSTGSEWTRVQIFKAHHQPILSLDVAPSKEYFLTSSADAVIAKYPVPNSASAASPDSNRGQPLKTINTKHAGQQGLNIRSDGKIFATAGWDSRVRVYSTKTMNELAVLKWHKEGCYSTAFAAINTENDHDARALTIQNANTAVVKSALDLIEQERTVQAQKKHWLAAGAKDGKISLWDIY